MISHILSAVRTELSLHRKTSIVVQGRILTTSTVWMFILDTIRRPLCSTHCSYFSIPQFDSFLLRSFICRPTTVGYLARCCRTAGMTLTTSDCSRMCSGVTPLTVVLTIYIKFCVPAKGTRVDSGFDYFRLLHSIPLVV